MSHNPSIRVVKLGGSLLDDPQLPDRLRQWLSMQPPARHCLIVGGGRFADAVRQYDRILCLGEEPCDALALKAMSVSAALVANLLPDATVLRTLDDCKRSSASLAIFDVAHEEENHRRGGVLSKLPRCWDVTSDSIAATVAEALHAELVLLKSTLEPAARTCESAAGLGLVDRHFPQAAACLHGVRVVNLRTAGFPEQLLEVVARGNCHST